MTTQTRQPAGTPTGGQFTATERSEADLELTATDADAFEPSDGVVVGGDGYASHGDCDPEDAIPGFFPDSDDDCWICGEEL